MPWEAIMTAKSVRRVCGIVLVIVPSLACSQAERGPKDAQRDKFSATAKRTWAKRHKATKRELAGLEDHAWAGVYYQGDGVGVNATLTLAPQSGFVFIWRGCLGVYDRNYGGVTTSEHGTLQLVPKFENDRRGFQGVASELIPIAWGDRRYLVPVKKVTEFCNAVNSKREPRTQMRGFFFLRRGDHEKPARGVPEIPEEYQAYLLKEPILAEIVEVHDTDVEEGVGGWVFRSTTVTLNVGHAEGVLPGMSFRVYEPKEGILCRAARVLSVGEKTSRALIRQGVAKEIKAVQPVAGWKLTTGPRRPSPSPKQVDESSATGAAAPMGGDQTNP